MPLRRRLRPMLRLVALGGLVLSLVPSLVPAARAAGGGTAAGIQALQAALNPGGPGLAGLLSAGPGLDPSLVELRRRALLKQFPDARWTLTPGPGLRDGRSTVELRVQGSHKVGGSTFRLDAHQQLALTSGGGRITSQEVIREHTILRSGEQDLPVTLLIPDAVLTGQRYDVDVVLDEPLNGDLVAGGLVALTSSQVAAMETPVLKLETLGGGGLFKTVQAPYNPGEQSWAVLLVHPKGIVSATKRVRVVADRAQLTP